MEIVDENTDMSEFEEFGRGSGIFFPKQ